MSRPEQPEPFLRGCAWDGVDGMPYPRADPADLARLPGDTVGTARIPVGARFELVGDAGAVEVAYTTTTDDLGYRGAGAGTTFAVVRGGGLVHWCGAGTMPVPDPDTQYRIGSITKTFTAMLVLGLRDEGKLTLDAPAEQYWPELAQVVYPFADAPRFTLRHLLTHGSGLPRLGNFDYTKPDSNVSEAVLRRPPAAQACIGRVDTRHCGARNRCLEVSLQEARRQVAGCVFASCDLADHGLLSARVTP